MGAWIMVEKLGHDDESQEYKKKKSLKVKTRGGERPRAEQKGDQAIFYA